MGSSTDDGKVLFDTLISVIHSQRILMEAMAEKIEQLTIGGGSGNGFQVYESNKLYKKYQALIDPNTDTAYLVVPHEGDEYTSVTVEEDCRNGNLKLLGFDSQIVTFGRPPEQAEIERLPEKVIVVEYNPQDTPYTGIISSPEHEVDNNG